MPSAPSLPCASRIDVYDVLIDSEPGTQTYQAAHAEAARLCAGCAHRCVERITPDSGPRTVAEFNATQWIPKRKPLVLPTNSPPPRRRNMWASTVVALAGQGVTAAAIATALGLSESAVTRLLAPADRVA